MGVWCHYMDWKDNEKSSIVLLDELGDEDEMGKGYFYEIIVFTGMGLNSGTKSNVDIIFETKLFF